MRLPLTLSRYIARHFLMFVLSAALAITVIAMLIDLVELFRRASERDAVPFSAILSMALLKAPSMLQKLFPFAMLIGSMLALTRLTRSQELVVARAAGVSAWQFLLPALGVALGLGIFMAAVFNPIASVMLLKFEKVEVKYLSSRASLLSVSPSGLWLRQVEDGEVSEHVIHALRISQSDMRFSNLTVYTFDRDRRFSERLDASSAVLAPGALTFSDVTRSRPGQPPEWQPVLSIPTTLKIAQLQDSFASPETISFWKLPSFIGMLENAGFSALKHRLYWHGMLASPFLYAGMVMIAALFSLRLPRLGRIGQLVVGGVACGFLLHFFNDIVGALGMAGTLPVALAAWAPAGIILMLGAGTLLHLEDG